MKIMKNIRAFALLLLAVAATSNSAWAQSAKTAPAGKAYTIRNSAAAVGGGTVAYQWYRNNVPLPAATEMNYTVPAHEAYGSNVEFKRRADCGGANVVWSNAVLVSFTNATSSAIMGSTPVCVSTSGLVYSVTDVPGTTYTWSVPSGWSITAGQGTNIVTVTAGSTAGSYNSISVTPSSTIAGSSITGTSRSMYVVTVVTPPSQPSSISGTTAACSGKSFSYYVTNVAGVTYTWSVPSGWSITSGQGTRLITVTAGTNGGNISVTPYSPCGASGTAQTLAVTANATPAQPSEITGSTSICTGSPGVPYSVTSVAGVTYTWTVPSGWSITAGQGTSSITVTASSSASSGNISVTPSCGGNGTARTLAVAATVCPNCTSGVIINGICWANKNVGASNIDEYSPYYQWNRTTAWAATGSVSGWNSTADQSSTWTNNPCPSGWRLPTKVEFQNMLNSSGTMENMAGWITGGQRGVRSGVNGRFYGPGNATCTISNMTGCIFLPAGGVRYYTNGGLDQGSGLNYWVNEQYSSTEGYCFYAFDDDSGYAGNWCNKANALPIRCVMQ